MNLRPSENTQLYGMANLFFNEIIDHFIVKKKCQLKFYYQEKKVWVNQL